MKLAALISGGKDSWFAAYKESKKHELACLISIKSKNPESYMFHIPNIHLVEMQAEAAGIPLVTLETEGVKEEELEDLKQAIQIAQEKYRIEGIVSGAIKSNYQKQRVDKICSDLGLASLAPLWQANEELYITELIKNFHVIIVGIAADGLKKEFLGTRIGLTFLDRMRSLNVSPIGEGGEFESFVLECPLFKKKIKVEDFEIKMENEITGHYLIKKAILV
ncbi:MAG: diphthine--ammonia ligase [Nanoarchaeota archaeon]|nr:diphthine--ammonia ligase [Nanoarchaeota archaeon]MBU1004837.1 diphthine--ammonia ligase [Nanoarchaeota archaeon]MBU1946775.1 diphthine--ammonia ligase [Nanoarchaeota archaeon]